MLIAQAASESVPAEGVADSPISVTDFYKGVTIDGGKSHEVGTESMEEAPMKKLKYSKPRIIKVVLSHLIS